MGETMKTGTRQAVIGIRLSETRFQIVNGTSMHHVQQVHDLIINKVEFQTIGLDHPCDWWYSEAEHQEVPQ